MKNLMQFDAQQIKSEYRKGLTKNCRKFGSEDSISGKELPLNIRNAA